MKKYMSKALAFFLAIILIASLAACGSKEDPKPPQSDAPESSVPESSAPESVDPGGDNPEDGGESEPPSGPKAGDTGIGPATIDTRYGVIEIPDGLDYEIFILPLEDSDVGTVHIDFGYGYTGSYIEISSSRMVASIDDAVQECIRMSTWNSPEDAELKGEIVYNGVTYKKLSIETREKAYLLSYYEEPSDSYPGRYVEICTDTSTMEIDDAAIVAILESIVYK